MEKREVTIKEGNTIYQTLAELIYENLDKYVPGEKYSIEKANVPFGELLVYFDINIKDNFDCHVDTSPNPEVEVRSIQFFALPEDQESLIEFIEFELLQLSSEIENLIRKEL